MHICVERCFDQQTSCCDMLWMHLWMSHVIVQQVVIDDNLGFAKDRTISRLIEMQSDEYREQHAAQRAPHLLQALHEAKTS